VQADFPPVEPSLEFVADSLLVAVDLLGVFVFALSGALLAVRKRFDVFGVAVLALAAALGGGIIRDLLIGDVPPVALRDWRYGAAALVAAGVGFVAHHTLERIGPAVRFFDAIGLGFFAVAGTSKALAFGLPPFAAVAMGVLTGAGGGALRDLLAGEVPLVLRREIYAVAALAGSTVVAVATMLDRYGAATAGAAIIVTVALRLTAVWRRWNAPRAPLPPD
jgi:uncharacterized membrane protein YeiH